MLPLVSEKNIHYTFQISILFKGCIALLEILGGIVVLFTTKAVIISTLAFLTQEEFQSDSTDVIVHYLLHIANNFSVTTQYFISFYLLSHGLVKLILIIGLLKEKLWAYPSAITVFTLFGIYQMERYFHTYSMWLLILTAVDLLVILLTLHEYNYIKKHNKTE